MSGGVSGVVQGGRLSAVLALVVVAGCGSTPPGAPTDTGTELAGPGANGSQTATVTDTPTPEVTVTTTMTKPPELESILYRLVQADNETAFAEEHGLDVDDSRVLVVVELEDGADVPDGYDLTVTAEFATEVEAYVAIDDLLALAGEESVRVVRTPTVAEPQG